MLSKIGQEIFKGVVTLIAAGLIATIATSFQSTSAEQQKKIDKLESEVDELRMLSAKQSVWNLEVMDMLKEIKDEQFSKNSKRSQDRSLRIP